LNIKSNHVDKSFEKLVKHTNKDISISVQPFLLRFDRLLFLPSDNPDFSGMSGIQFFVITIETPQHLYGFRFSSAVAEGVYDD
jgi:hypothetical protein